MKRPFIKCLACNGTSQVKLSDPLWQCIKTLRHLGSATAIEIHNKLGEPISRSATNGRLTELERLGLVKRVREGGKYFYLWVEK